MALNLTLLAELNEEAANTRKLLELVPDSRFDFKPHEKSSTLQRLASHVAEIPVWTEFTINMDVLDLAANHTTPFSAENTAELLARHEENIERAKKALEGASDETLMKTWTLKKGDFQIMAAPKANIIRKMTSNHLYHHRGQLTVYLRLLDIPIPGIYGASADDLAAMKAANN